jgi:hypothetical protein
MYSAACRGGSRTFRRQLCVLQTPFGIAKRLGPDIRATGRTSGSVVRRVTHIRHPADPTEGDSLAAPGAVVNTRPHQREQAKDRRGRPPQAEVPRTFAVEYVRC